MKRAAVLLLTILAFGLSGFAQTTYTAHLYNGLTQPATTGQVCFHLKNFGTNVPYVSGTGVLADPDPACVTAAPTGTVTGTIFGSDVIGFTGCVPSALNPCTYWTVEYWVNGQLKHTADYTNIVGPIVTLDSLTPMTTQPAIPAPTGDSTYCRLDGGNCGLRGPITTQGITDSSPGGYSGTAGTFSGTVSVGNTAQVADRSSPISPARFGALYNGTDESTAFSATLAAAYAQGGGIIDLPCGKTLRVDSCIVLPNDGQAVPSQPPITLRGCGGRWNGSWGTETPGASVLDMRCASGTAKLDTRGKGALTIEGVNFADGGSDSVPFIQTTNTTILASKNAFWGSGAGGAASTNDAFVLGGTTTSADGTAIAAFQGYGSVIEKNYFARIRRGVYGRVYANAVPISNNTWSASCGGTSAVGAIEFNGTTGFSKASNLVGNVIEMTNYVYGVRLSTAGVLGSLNSFWDAGAGSLAAYFFAGTVNSSFTCESCYMPFPTTAFKPFVDYLGGTFSAFARWSNEQYITGSFRFNGSPTSLTPAFVISPDPKASSESYPLFSINRSQSDATSPSAGIFSVTQGGTGVLHSSTGNASLAIGGTTSTLTIDQNSIVLNTGTLNIYAGDANSAVNIHRGWLGLPQYATASKPTLSGAAGQTYFDTTLNQLQISNGASYQTLPITTGATPADNATCSAGNMWYDASFLYVCTASGTVKRVAIAAF